MGKFFLTTLLAVAELERNMIIERTQLGKEFAKRKRTLKMVGQRNTAINRYNMHWGY